MASEPKFVQLSGAVVALAASISEKLGDGKLTVRELVELVGEIRALVELLWASIPVDEEEYVELGDAVLDLRDQIDDAFADGNLDVWEVIDLVSKLTAIAGMAREALTD